MAIDERRLQAWTGLGSEAQSRDTYATVNRVLESAHAPYYGKKFDCE
jgi:hypothetical protein